MGNSIKVIANVVANSQTQVQYETRHKIFNDVVWAIDTANDDATLLAISLKPENFHIFSALYLTDDMGLPLLLSKWQMKCGEEIDKGDYFMGIMCRKTGKSTLLSAKTAHTACRLDNWRLSCIAPSKKQDFVYQDVRKHFEKDETLYATFIENGGITTDKKIVLNNGSKIFNHTIGLATMGELIRGEKGNVLFDEVGLVDKEILSQIIFPIMIDAYSRHTLWLIGTAMLKVNPDLKEMWENWQKDDDCGTYSIDWKEGVIQGCVNEKKVRERMEHMTPDEIDMEFNARFPIQSGRPFPWTVLHACGKNELGWLQEGFKDAKYIMSVDWAKRQDTTQILVGEIKNGILIYRYWLEIDPKHGIVDWDDQLDIVKRIFKKFGCDTIIPDATSAQDKLCQDLFKDPNGIPETNMYKNEKGEFGYKGTGERNHELWRNHQRIMTTKRIFVPKEEPFFTRWKREHNELMKRVASHGRYMIYEEPKNGKKDLAVCSAQLSWLLEDVRVSPALLDVGAW